MARALRIEQPGAWYHLTARGNERRAIFRDDTDRLHLQELLGQAVESFGVMLHAWVFMNNHYHLLLETPVANLSRVMQWINVSYSVWFNRRHQRAGHLFQGRFKAIVVEAQSWALGLSRYVHLNPVRTGAFGLDKGARRRQRQGLDGPPEVEEVERRLECLRGYRWSSYRAYVGREPAPAWLECGQVRELIGRGSVAQRRQAYRDYVEGAVREGLGESPWEALVGQVLLGGQEFVDRLRAHLAGDPQEQPSLRQLQRRAGWAEVVVAVERLKGEAWSQFRDRHGDWGRDLALYLGRKHCGLRLKELGMAVGGLDYRSVGWAVAQLARRAGRDHRLARLVKQATRKIKNPEM